MGRGHTEIKGLLALMPAAAQEQYKQVAERYADIVEAKAKAPSAAAAASLEEHMGHLLLQQQGPSGRQVGEQLLQTAAALTVSLAAQEAHLRDVVAALEAKQLLCDSLLQRLQAALEVALARRAAALQQQQQQQQQQLAAAAAGLRAAVQAGAQQLKQQVEAEIARVTSMQVPVEMAQQQLQQLQQQAASWAAAVGQSTFALDALLEAAAKLAAAAAALPENHRFDAAPLQQAVQQAQDTKKAVRQQKAQVQQLLRILGSHLAFEQQRQQQLFQQQQQHFPPFGPAAAAAAAAAPPAPGDLYSAYALPTQHPQQQQQQQQQQTALQPQLLPAAGPHIAFPGLPGAPQGAPLGAPLGAPQGGPQLPLGAPHIPTAPQMPPPQGPHPTAGAP
ncbi:hypothetical protein, conserved [Eimeria necatrix]|uniref:Uncharacterized protein n=1 Tax=Eimeria necatrix TaxID=51315 RepID=U6MZQ6_9EIME|nr:hypothetical protein, conserved [Eimeria necatrix]CDJ67994.1 hypothetical protein, conserved [Eimeria necatrix]